MDVLVSKAGWLLNPTCLDDVSIVFLFPLPGQKRERQALLKHPSTMQQTFHIGTIWDLRNDP